MPKKTKVSEHTTIDGGTGVVLSEKKVSVYQSNPEDYFVKVYLENIQKLGCLTKGEMIVFFCLLRYIDYKNKVVLNIERKKKIAKKSEFTLGTVNKCVAGLHGKNMLIHLSMGSYLVNPEYVGKGNWKDISELRLGLGIKNLLPK